MDQEREDAIKRLKRQVVNFKLELHDLSEELPLGWEKIPDVAARTYEAYKELARLQAAD
jgi:hypothetical protein